MPSELNPETLPDPVREPTDKQIAASRANGAKSHGPATEEGRARSSRNALRHGLAAPALPPVSIVLPTESADDFQTLLNSYLDELAPAGLLETELVETMAAARWRLRRISTIETTLLTMEMDRLAEYIDRSFQDLHRDPTPDDRLAWTFHRVAEKPSLSLLLRYEGTLNRSYARALKQLQQLQSVRNRPQPNEPKPAASLALPSGPAEPPSTPDPSHHNPATITSNINQRKVLARKAALISGHSKRNCRSRSQRSIIQCQRRVRHQRRQNDGPHPLRDHEAEQQIQHGDQHRQHQQSAPVPRRY